MAIEMGNYHYIAKVGEELHFSAGFFQEKDGWGGGGTKRHCNGKYFLIAWKLMFYIDGFENN